MSWLLIGSTLLSTRHITFFISFTLCFTFFDAAVVKELLRAILSFLKLFKKSLPIPHIGMQSWPAAIMQGSPMREIRSHDSHVDTIVINTNPIVPIQSRIAWINSSSSRAVRLMGRSSLFRKKFFFSAERRTKPANLLRLSVTASATASHNRRVGGRISEQRNVYAKNIRISLLLSLAKHTIEPTGHGQGEGKKDNSSFSHVGLFA